MLQKIRNLNVKLILPHPPISMTSNRLVIFISVSIFCDIVDLWFNLICYLITKILDKFPNKFWNQQNFSENSETKATIFICNVTLVIPNYWTIYNKKLIIGPNTTVKIYYFRIIINKYSVKYKLFQFLLQRILEKCFVKIRHMMNERWDLKIMKNNMQ